MRPGASGGDGSRASPFGTIAAALAAAGAGTIVALSKGSFDEAVVLSSGVSLRGACAAETRLTAAGSGSAVVEVTASGAALEGLTIAGADRIGLRVSGAGASVRVEDVVVDDVQTVGVAAVSGAGLTARSLVVRATRPAADGRFGHGLEVSSGATAVVSRAVVDANHAIAVFASDEGTSLKLTDAVVRGTRPRASDRQIGRGMNVQLAARVTASRVLLEDNTELGVFVTSEGTELALSDAVVRGTRSQQSNGRLGRGIGVYGGSRADLDRVVLDRNQEHGAFASDPGSRLVLRDALVRDTEPRDADRLVGRGVEVIMGAHAELTRVHLDRNREFGVLGAFEGTELVLTDVAVRDTEEGEEHGELGRGVSVELGVLATLTRVVLERNTQAGLYASSENVPGEPRCAPGMLGPGVPGTRVTVSDLVVRETRAQTFEDFGGLGVMARCGATVELTRALLESNRAVALIGEEAGTRIVGADLVLRDTSAQPDGALGRALNLQLGATAELSRVLAEGNREIALFVAAEGTRLVLADAIVRDTGPQELTGIFGRGLNLQQGASAEVSRAVIEASLDVGVFVASEGTRAVLTDFVVRDVRARACAATTCADAPAGMALVTYLGASAEVSRFSIARAELCAVQIARGGQLDLRDGEVAESAVGVCLQEAGYDTARLTDNVLFRDNGATLEATSYPVPEPVDPDL